MTIFVHIGPCAVRVGRYWVGVASGNRFCRKLRTTAEKAIKDAAAEERQEK